MEDLSHDRDFETFLRIRGGALAGAIAAQLAALSDAQLRRVPFDLSIYVDFQSVGYQPSIELSCVSLQQTNPDGKLVYPSQCPEGQTRVLSFVDCLNLIGRRGDDEYEANDSPYQSTWTQMSRAQMLQLLIGFAVESDPIRRVAYELEHEGFFG